MLPHSWPSKFSRNAHRWCAVIGKPGSAQPEGTPAMVLLEFSFLVVMSPHSWAHRWCAAIRKPGSAWLEGTTAMTRGTPEKFVKFFRGISRGFFFWCYAATQLARQVEAGMHTGGVQ